MDKRSRLIEAVNQYVEKLSYKNLRIVFYFVKSLSGGEKDEQNV